MEGHAKKHPASVPALGRLNAVDPMASKYASLSPYNYALNDPVFWNDPLGLEMTWGDIFRIIERLWNEVPIDGGGAGWSKSGGFTGGYGNLEAFYVGAGYMDATGSWGGGGGAWASSFGSAANAYASATGGPIPLRPVTVKETRTNAGWLQERIDETYQTGDGPGDGWKSFLPVALLLGGDVDLFVGGGVDVSAGGILILRGPDAGEFVNYLDRGVGLGLDLSIVGEGGFLFYTGDADNFTKDHLRGDRTEVSGAFLTWGGNVFRTPKDGDGERVIGVLGTYGLGINPLILFGIPAPWTFNVNWGGTELFNRNKK